jgi:enoyl-CoA hydratase/carnithine racemase
MRSVSALRAAAGEGGLGHEQRLEAVLAALERLPQPVVAAVDGFAVGAGLALAIACDLRICTTAARFGMPAVRTLGNAPALPTVARLVALVGAGRTRELLLTGRLVAADEALALGLATEVVPAGRLELRVNQLAEQLAAQAPVAMAVAKEAVRRASVEGRRDGDDLVVAAYESEDFREGVRALDERRAPRWEGR